MMYIVVYRTVQTVCMQAAAIARELLSGGSCPTADLLAGQDGGLPQLPTCGQGVSAKEQLAYLSQVNRSSPNPVFRIRTVLKGVENKFN